MSEERPSRSQQLSNPKLAPKLSATLPPVDAKPTAKPESKLKEKTLESTARNHARGLVLLLAHRAHDEESNQQADRPALALVDNASQTAGEVQAQEDLETAQYESAHLKPATEEHELAVEVPYIETGMVAMNTDEDRVLARHTVLPAIG
ncbi:uncharacterized protein RHO25_007048 [Cercospora beticola]|uniref:Uncharacterized protein n=1 Tax=Cercospora beticola TaxID=122368 RepID=A0ABZ0NS94_CERBT|nr:hypothetical protein RHO25_007048 [Cercospora beticola]